MTLLDRIAKKIRRTHHRFFYSRDARGILDTPPLAPGAMPLIVLSMVHSRDVMPYLVAIKSFARYVNPRQIVVVCDPSITEIDRYCLQTHIPHVVLRSADEFTHPDIPRGGCWERLYAISDYCKQDYVVQLDADTITMLPPAEVIHAVIAKTGFVMSGDSDAVLMSLQETENNAASWGPPSPGEDMQATVERNMATSNLPAQARYVRGCAGFTGFPMSDTMTNDLLLFSKNMQARYGKRWAEWGTEQITSNYLVANAGDTSVLPFLSYGTPDVMHAESILTHFIGFMRFTSDKYRAATLRTIRQLATPPALEKADVGIVSVPSGIVK
ncbi:MAG: hypothetical protein EOO38_02095 [Cytophagaceae bacterium]|nr:MAG: hypothetical protein EOO38_02095 [Cytophagaceae bacterium]